MLRFSKHFNLPKKFLSAVLAGIFVSALLQTHAQSFDFNDNCRKAYHSIVALRLNEGEVLLNSEQKKNPDNLIPVYIENYIDFLSIYTSDTRARYDELKKNKEVRLVQLTEGDQSSPYYLFTQAEVSIQWAATEIKFGDYLTAIFDIRKAFKALEENQKRFPDFRPNKKSLGVLYALIGSVPDKYKWGVNLLGLEGNIDKGIGYLRELTEYGQKNDFVFHHETVIYYAFLLFHLQSQSDAAWKVLRENGFPKKDDLMSVYACAHIGVYGKHTSDVVTLLSTQPASSFTTFPFLNYLYGLARLNKLDTDAELNFKQFVVTYKGENHIKSSFQKIAWCYLLKGDTVNYYHFINKAENLGATMVEADKQAQREAATGAKPNVSLLRARLLFDGGYYEQASHEMNKFSEESFKSAEEQTEYLYRFARIYDEWNKQDLALALYAKAIERGKDLPRYFAANSAFECGKIYEARGDKEKAKTYYQLCLSFENHEYKNGLDQKAKAGLNRINR